MAGIRVTVLLILNPEISVGDVAIKDILTILRVGLQVSGLNFLAQELDILGRQVLFDKRQIAIMYLFRELVLLNLLFQNVQKVYRVSSDL